MNRRLILVALVLAAAVVGGAADVPAPLPTDEELRARVESLEREVLELRRLLAEGTTGATLAATDAAVLAGRLDTLEAAVAGLRQDLEAAGEDAGITAEAVDDLSQGELQRAHLGVYGSIVGADYTNANSVIDGEAVELVVSGRPHQRLGFFTEIEFERAAAVGGERGGEVVVEQAHATFGLTSWLGFRAGILLMPFGNHNLDHYAPTREVISRPLVSHVVVPSDWTDNGAGFTGRQGLGGGWFLDYETYLVAGLGGDIPGLGMRAARQSFGTDNNNDKAVIGRLAFGLRDELETGVSYYTGAWDDASSFDLDGWAGHLAARLGPLRLSGEYNAFAVAQPALADMTLDGYYVRGVYDLFRGLLRRGGHGQAFPEARLSLVAEYGAVTIDQPTGADPVTSRESRWVFGLNYRPSHHWVLKLDREENTLDEGAAILHGDADAWLAAVGFVY